MPAALPAVSKKSTHSLTRRHTRLRTEDDEQQIECSSRWSLHFPQVAYIDTEGSFRPDRIIPIANRFNLDAQSVLGNVSLVTLTAFACHELCSHKCSVMPDQSRTDEPRRVRVCALTSEYAVTPCCLQIVHARAFNFEHQMGKFSL